MCSAARFAGTRFGFVPGIWARPSPPIRVFVVTGCELAGACLVVVGAPIVSRSAEIARSIADRCCSNVEMMLSMSFTGLLTMISLQPIG